MHTWEFSENIFFFMIIHDSRHPLLLLLIFSLTPFLSLLWLLCLRCRPSPSCRGWSFPLRPRPPPRRGPRPLIDSRPRVHRLWPWPWLAAERHLLPPSCACCWGSGVARRGAACLSHRFLSLLRFPLVLPLHHRCRLSLLLPLRCQGLLPLLQLLRLLLCWSYFEEVEAVTGAPMISSVVVSWVGA